MASIRLLECKPNGDIAFREPTSSHVPAYAILSHVWGKEEVLFQDLHPLADMDKTRRMAGWKKIEFCAKQAAADGLQYFWVDTCCIDKTSSPELSAAINSMFRWYENAARCYVYLSDVPKPGTSADDERAVIEEFKTSRWHQRGWTLQELVAPKLVEFFTSSSKRMGDKALLETEVHEITGIPKSALRGDALSGFSIKERLSWAESRNTTLEEDQAYCLMGICNVSMAVIYGEGKSRAFARLREAIHKQEQGLGSNKYAVQLNLSSLPEPVQFVAREKELSNMHNILHGHDFRACVVLYGLGGMGKTQLAREYIRRYKKKYTSVFWLNANDHESLRLSFRAIAQQILKSYPETSLGVDIEPEDRGRVERAVNTWFHLKDNTKWLLVVDNYDNPSIAGNADELAVDIREHLPQYDQGSVIITTRSAGVKLGHRIKVEKLPNIAQGIEILSNTSGRANIEHDSGAIALVKELDGFPLALSTAGAYLKHVTTTFSEYLRLYKTSWSKLQRASPLSESYGRPLYMTWQVTLDQIKKQNPSAARLLKLWAYFDRKDVWFELLRHAKSAKDEWIRKLVADELAFNEAVALLCSFGLVEPNQSLMQYSGTRGYNIQNSVHYWTLFVLNDEWDDDLARLALTCVASEILNTNENTNEKDWWLAQQRLLRHAALQGFFVLDRQIDLKGNYWTLDALGTLDRDQDMLVEAETMYTRALQGYKETLGLQHTSALNTVNNLGNLYLKQHRLVEAEQMYTRALQGYEKALGLQSTSTLNTVNNLGNLYLKQGKLDEAEQMYTRALQGYKEALGVKHTLTLSTANNLGLLYADQGRLVEADAMYNLAPQDQEEPSGPDGNDTSDLISVLSVDVPPSLTAGSTSSDISQITKTAAQEFAEILIQDDTLQPLFSAAIERAGFERYKRNFFRLLIKYAVDLRAAAGSKIQIEAARLVKSQANSIVYLVAESMQIEEMPTLLPTTVSKSDQESALEQYLEQQAQQSKISGTTLSIETSYDPSSNPEADEDEADEELAPETPKLINLDEVKTFMVESAAFRDLRESFSHFVFPPEEHNTTTPPEDSKQDLMRPLQAIDVRLEDMVATPYRLYWTCTCSHRHYDDYIETIPGSIARLVDNLHQNGVEAHVEMRRTDSFVFDILRSVYFRLYNAIVHLVTAGVSSLSPTPHHPSQSSTSASSSRPGQASSTMRTNAGPSTTQPVITTPSPGIQPSNVSTPTLTTITQDHQASADSQSDFILLCSDERGWLTTREDLEVSQVRSDRELFELFRSRLEWSKRWTRRYLSLKTIQRISFVKFALRQDQEIDQLQLHQIPPHTATHYDFQERDPGYVPPIGNRYFMHRFSNPAYCRDSTFCLAQIPKRVRGRPQYGSAPDHFTAWGLYFQETPDAARLCLCSVITFAISLSFGVAWAAEKKSIQDGFAVASYILALMMLTISTVQVAMEWNWL